MKKIYPFLLLFLIFSCASVKKYNEDLKKTIAPEKLKKDVDFAYLKLQELHPNLYWYISKDSLYFKFDSLKTTIAKPLKALQFYEKLEPVIAKIKEGHLRLIAPAEKYTKKEIKELERQKGLLGRLNYVIENNKIFVKDNADQFENIKVGTEIFKLKDISVENYLVKYRKLINSDGLNTTFQKYALSRSWPQFFTIENGILDSVKIETKYNNEVKDFYIHREKITKKQEKEADAENKKLTKSETGKTKDYNIITKSFNRDLQFPTKDSAIAYMKIKTFSGTFSRKFYKESFKEIKIAKSKVLILDIRDNLGGSLYEINNLYSYLVSEKFQFINDIEVTSRKSMFHADYFKSVPNIVKPFAGVLYPFYLIGTAFSTKKKDGKIYLRNNSIFAIKKPKKDTFKGKIYVLINGSSFSAASILPSKLKSDKRAIIVGEETGGANDGTVAGRYSTVTLPNSKLKLPIGLMFIQPNIQFTNTKKGVTPDEEILLSTQQVLAKKDIILDAIIKEIRSENLK